jgi:hypothetical protein
MDSAAQVVWAALPVEELWNTAVVIMKVQT